MGLFGRRKAAAAAKKSPELPASSSSSSATSSPAKPVRPPRSEIHAQTFKKYQEAFEKAKQEELRKLDLQAEKLANRFRTGSVILRLDLAVKNSSKKLETIVDHASEVPLTMPKELSEVLSSPVLRNGFRTFLRKKFASESLMLFETIEMFKKIQSDEWRLQMAGGMMDTFINEDSQYPVNISFADRSELLARQKTSYWPQDSFDGVQREMYDLMNTNYFLSFCRTYWPGGVLLAIPGGPFSSENISDARALGSTTSFDGLGSNSTTASNPALIEMHVDPTE